jgi:hypothetical protein
MYSFKVAPDPSQKCSRGTSISQSEDRATNQQSKLSAHSSVHEETREGCNEMDGSPMQVERKQ